MISALAASGCGGGATLTAKPGPPPPVNVTAYIDDARLSLSPASVGAGPVTLVVTNQASQTETLTVRAAGGTQALASTGPINPQATAEVTVDLSSRGDYTVAASQPRSSSVHAATLQIGPPRSGAAATYRRRNRFMQ